LFFKAIHSESSKLTGTPNTRGSLVIQPNMALTQHRQHSFNHDNLNDSSLGQQIVRAICEMVILF